eukprot:m.1585103 g.1585103  ORF g.1585103 m.1585103 type:complete len:114 (-) comp25322_c0_seq16:4114-4455(-)
MHDKHNESHTRLGSAPLSLPEGMSFPWSSVRDIGVPIRVLSTKFVCNQYLKQLCDGKLDPAARGKTNFADEFPIHVQIQQLESNQPAPMPIMHVATQLCMDRCVGTTTHMDQG